MKKLLLLVLILFYSSIVVAEVNYNKFGSFFKNPIKWMETLPLNTITTDELIKGLGPPEDVIDLDGTKYLSYPWGTTVTKIVFYLKDGVVIDARYDPVDKSQRQNDATITMKVLGGLGFKTGKSVLASELK